MRASAVSSRERPRCQPIVSVDGTTFFVDLDNRLLRAAFKPGTRIDFDAVDGRRICEIAGVVTCRRCGMSAIVADSARPLCCMRCRSAVRQG